MIVGSLAWQGTAIQLALLLARLVVPGVSVREPPIRLGGGLIQMLILGVVALVVLFFWRSQRERQVGPANFSHLEVVAGPASTSPQTTEELVQQLRAIDWFQFEKLVALIYRKLGYVVARRGAANPDGGIDLVIEKAGERRAVQCKQWKTWNVGVKAVREFLGALTDAGIPKGIFITLCGYSGDAKQLADKHGIEILNETGLARLIEGVDGRFDPEVLAILGDSRKFCPKCESEMVVRTAKKGPGAGQRFWGCSTYPRCRFTVTIA